MGSSKTECTAPALQAIGDRLLDWFSVIMADAKRRQTHNRPKGNRPPEKKRCPLFIMT